MRNKGQYKMIRVNHQEYIAIINVYGSTSEYLNILSK